MHNRAQELMEENIVVKMLSIYPVKHLADIISLAIFHRQRDQNKPDTNFVQQHFQDMSFSRSPSHYLKVGTVLGGA